MAVALPVSALDWRRHYLEPAPITSLSPVQTSHSFREKIAVLIEETNGLGRCACGSGAHSLVKFHKDHSHVPALITCFAPTSAECPCP